MNKRLCLAFFPLYGCTSTMDPCGEVTLNDQVGTIAQVSWETDKASDSWIEFGRDLELATPVMEEATFHEHTVLGLPAGERIPYRIWSERGARSQTCDAEIESGPWPDFVSPYEVTAYVPDEVSSRYVLIANAGEEESAPVVLDRRGNLVWYAEKDSERVQTQLEFRVDGSGLILLEQDRSRIDPEMSQLRIIDWELGVNEVIPVWGGHHKFFQHEDGTIAYLSVDIRQWTHPDTGQELEVVGDTIIELSPDGEERVAFTVWDAFSIEDSDSLDTAYYGGMVDWTHANSIFYSAERNTYLVSLGKLDTVVEVDRDTAEVIDIINGDTYTFLSGTTPFNYQHDAKWTDSGTLLMTTTMGGTFGVEYAIDRDAKTIEQVWSHGQDQNILAVVLGEVDELPNCNRFVSYGMGGLVQEVNPDGQVVWELQARQAVDRIASVRFFDDFYSN